MLESLIAWLLDRFRDLGYPGIVVLMAIESSVLPLPSELVMPPAGYLAAKGEMSFWVAIACGVLGSILGALANYGLANWLGRPFIRRLGRGAGCRAGGGRGRGGGGGGGGGPGGGGGDGRGGGGGGGRGGGLIDAGGAVRGSRPGAGCGVQMVRQEGDRPARVARQRP